MGGMWPPGKTGLSFQSSIKRTSKGTIHELNALKGAMHIIQNMLEGTLVRLFPFCFHSRCLHPQSSPILFPSNLPPVRPPRDLFQPLAAATTDVAMATIATAPAATSPEQPSAAPSATADIDFQSQLRDTQSSLFHLILTSCELLEGVLRLWNGKWGLYVRRWRRGGRWGGDRKLLISFINIRAHASWNRHRYTTKSNYSFQIINWPPKF